MSYGKHWDEINNKRTVLLSQSFKNQSTQNHTSYTLEVKKKPHFDSLLSQAKMITVTLPDSSF